MCSSGKVKETLRETMDFLEDHQTVIDCHVVDFLWNNHWELLPKSLREEFDADKEKITKNIHGILSKNSSCEYQHLREFLEKAEKHGLASFAETDALEDFLPEAESTLKVSDFMTPKKMHEVKSACRLISWLCRKDETPTVLVDAGDGKGYLSSCLAFEYNFPVIGLEANADYLRSARKRVDKLKKKWRTPEREGNYKSLAVTVTSDLSVPEISKNLFPTINQSNFCLCGLHTCGDLAVSCLEIFARDPQVKYLCNISCCYNLLSKFPISNFLKGKGFTLSDKGKMLACQSLNRIISDGTYPKDSLHFRAIFEKLLKQKFPERKFEQLGKNRSDNFIDYFKSSCDKMNLDYFYSDQELEEELNNYDGRYFDLFYVLRSSLASAIEAVILLDRILFLMEDNAKTIVKLVKVFNREISPRCYAIVAWKRD